VYRLPCDGTAVEAVNLRHGQDNDLGAQNPKKFDNGHNKSKNKKAGL
jgi:hypothetical protein